VRHLYSFLLYLLAPLVLLKLYLRGRKAPAYRLRWGERFALFSENQKKKVIWFHTVSVGETEAAFPLIHNIQRRYPDQTILVTTTTPTGSARVKALFKGTVEHVYLPYDLPDAVTRFLSHFSPSIAVMIETEIWPNLFHQCHQRNIPLLIINARLSEKSTRGYQKLKQLTGEALGKVSHIAARSENDAERFISLGAPTAIVSVAGNIKFDLKLSTDLRKEAEEIRQSLFLQRPTLIAASTHEKEDEKVLAAFKEIRKAILDVLLILVPRHPERFDTVAALCQKEKFSLIKRSNEKPCSNQTDVFLLNTMGELKLFSTAADIAFVGGSLVPTGGHNVLEPAAAGVPVLFGPHMFNFSEIAELLLEKGAAIQVKDEQQLAKEVIALFEHPDAKNELGQKGLHFVEENRGTLEKLEALMASYLDTKPSR
jgi:3-deoxy-D-manno-octulosonic-acid transferase